MYSISIIILLFIYLGTKYVNYYYKFYHIYQYLDVEQKHEYFTNHRLVYLLSLNNNVKRYVIENILIPVIKLNYMAISVVIALLYTLCESNIDDKIMRSIIIHNNVYDKIHTKQNKIFTTSQNISSHDLTKNIHDEGVTIYESKLPTQEIYDDKNNMIDINSLLNIKNETEIEKMLKQNIQNDTNNDDLEDYIYKNIETQQEPINNELVYRMGGYVEPDILQTNMNDDKKHIDDEEINITDIDYGEYINNLIISETLPTTQTSTLNKKIIRIGKKIKNNV